MYGRFLLVFTVFSMLFSSHGLTDPRDVFAINSLYVSLEFPPLMGWLAIGGDPCVELWQGVGCVFTNITSIILPGANLRGTLGGNLNMFTSIIEIDFGNNSIGGIIPLNLPPTVSNLSLSNNQLIGVIPETISSLSQLTSLDLSGNSLFGQLPLSMASLTFLTTLNLQNNQLSGTLDVLQDLPLRDLNIENNLFSGPIPLKLLNITNFRGRGNPFNTTVIPPPQVSPAAAPYLPPSSDEVYGPSAPETPPISSKSKFFTTRKIIGFVVAGILIIVIVALGLYLLISKFCRKKHVVDKFSKGNEIDTYHVPEGRVNNQSSLQKANNVGELSKKENLRRQDGHETFSQRKNLSLNLQAEQESKGKRAIPAVNPMDDHTIDMSTSKVNFKSNVHKATPPPPMPRIHVERSIVNPKQPVEISMKHSTKNVNFGDRLQYFTIASLQEYTNSFSQENLIGRGLLGSVYKGVLPDGKLLAIKKLDNRASSMQNEDDFLKLLSSIYKLQHPNVVDIVGYCAEHGQLLIIYEYCGSVTLYDALHLDDQMHARLSWAARIRIALGAARALDYLHEFCEPPMMHRNFKSANILLLEDKLVAKVSDCGLAPLMTTNTASKLSGQLTIYGYGAPEMEAGNYTYVSDIYSFGVVMLELLTGRKSFERSRPRGEQSLVRWAIPQLHDIDSLSRMVDPSLNGAYPSKALSRFADIISRCLQTEPEFRPPMSEVVQDLLCIT